MSANSKKIENKKLDFIIRILDLYEFINSLEDNVETLIGENDLEYRVVKNKGLVSQELYTIVQTLLF